MFKFKILHKNESQYRPFWESILFFFKVSISCTIIHYLIQVPYSKLYVLNSTLFPPFLLSCVHACIYYPVGYFLHYCYEADYFSTQKVSRPRSIPKQAMNWSIIAVLKGELIGFIANCVFYYVANYIGGMSHEFNAYKAFNFTLYFLSTFLWFLFAIWWADFGFYWSHYIFHHYPLIYKKIHKMHHTYQYQVAWWSAEIKTPIESWIVSTIDLLPHLLLGGHLTHMLAWIIVGVIYNLEGHSGYSLLYINLSFHDYHHTMNRGNYGIAFYLDHLFGTSKQWEEWGKFK